MSKYDDSLRKLLDIHEIQQLLLEYSIALDARDLDFMDRLFTDDAQLNLVGDGVFSIAEYKKFASAAVPELDTTQHFCTPAVIRIEGDKAFSRCFFLAQHARNSLAPHSFCVVGGYFDDELVRRNGEWRIFKRNGTTTWVEGNTAVINFPIPPGGTPWSEARNIPAWMLKP